MHKLLSLHKTNTATGPDGISGHMLRNTASSISRDLTKIFHLSITHQKLPMAWKVSNINPIPKSKDIDKCSNYRPISLVSLPSKILEVLIHHHVSRFLSKHNLLSDIQFGFRPRPYTQEALLSVTNMWHSMLAKHTQIAAVFLDVRKAFDSVPHNRLIKLLHSIGIQGPLLYWFRDYLTSRSQQAVLNGESSTTTPVTSGVPQGSILGPFMFNIFMNSISKIPLSADCHLMLYADDILLFKLIENSADLKDFQRDLHQVTNWKQKQGLNPDHKKTQYLPISRCKKSSSAHHLPKRSHPPPLLGREVPRSHHYHQSLLFTTHRQHCQDYQTSELLKACTSTGGCYPQL